MPSLGRISFFVVAAVSLQALANPVPLPLAFYRAADYQEQTAGSITSHSSVNAATYRIKHTTTIHTSTRTEVEQAGPFAAEPTSVSTHMNHKSRDTAGLNDLLANLNLLDTYYGQAQDCSQNIKTLASQSASAKDNDPDFQQKCAAALTEYHSNMLDMSDALTSITNADKGLLNYNRQNDVETMLKNMINLNKDTLMAIDVMVYNIPGLGSTLGPIVYEIKCIIEEILDAVENLSDAVVNAIQPLLQSLLGQAVTSTCNTGVEIAGICA